jgi:peptide-methionine (S)-S-oxide reductase
VPFHGRRAGLERSRGPPDPAGWVYKAAIVTKIEPDRGFFPAEDYHQDFMTRHPGHRYIAYNDLPKIDDLKRLFPDAYRVDPVLVAAERSTH